MARRIKCMLGEYEPKEDFPTDDCEEPINTQVENMLIPSTNKEISELPEQKNFEDVHLDDIKEKQADLTEEPEIIQAEIKDTIQTISIDSKVAKDSNNSLNSSTETSINSRRCSLKRQCKDKISLPDYNPMLTIRTLKRPRINSSSKGRSFENFDEVDRDRKAAEAKQSSVTSVKPKWTREGKEAFARKRMDEMKVINEQLKLRRKEVDRDRKAAEAKQSSVTSVKILPRRPSVFGRDYEGDFVPKPVEEREWDIGKDARKMDLPNSFHKYFYKYNRRFRSSGRSQKKKITVNFQPFNYAGPSKKENLAQLQEIDNECYYAVPNQGHGNEKQSYTSKKQRRSNWKRSPS